MNKAIFAFILGAAIGSVVTWKLTKTKYEQIAQEEIDSVKEVFSNRSVYPKEDKDIPNGHKATSAVTDKPSLSEYAKKLADEGYTDYSANKKEEKGGTEMGKPYVITPEEFGAMDGYDAESLNYYSDGILADDWDNPIENVEEMVGTESLTHFGEYEDDSVFVRNDTLKTDYEILRDERKFSEVAHSDSE